MISHVQIILGLGIEYLDKASRVPDTCPAGFFTPTRRILEIDLRRDGKN